MIMTCTACTERPATRRGLCARCYMRVWNRQRLYGTWESQRVDAAPVRAHIETLLAAGLSVSVIAEQAGVERKRITDTVHGRRDRKGKPPVYVLKSTADAILAVRIPADITEVAKPSTVVPGIGAQRRLQALVANGYTLSDLADRLGLCVSTTSLLPREGHGVTARRHLEVKALFDRLQLEPGPSDRARRFAARKNWALPLEWDEDTIDDPNAKPVQGIRWNTWSTARERREQVQELTAQGLTAQQIADQLRIDARSVVRYRSEKAS